MEPGDFVLWDSRTMHYACLPEGDQIRHVQYICMTPRRFATEKALELKKYCFENYMGTTHWPHWYVSLRLFRRLDLVLTLLLATFALRRRSPCGMARCVRCTGQSHSRSPS
jgi:hypothetical protein